MRSNMYSQVRPPRVGVRWWRRAWLTLDGRTVELEDLDAGYACVTLDLGWPEVREVVNNRPQRNGIDDRTRLVGGRVVTAEVAAWGQNMALDDIARLFAPFLNPAYRPVLHYVTFSNEVGERTITLRASDFAAPMVPPYDRPMHLSWVAPDPTAYSTELRTAAAWAGPSTVAGIVFNDDQIVFNDTQVIFPSGSGQAVPGVIDNRGDSDIEPLIRIYGPITAPRLVGTVAGRTWAFAFTPATVIDPGDWVTVDMAAGTVYFDDNPAVSMMGDVSWSTSSWLAVPAGAQVTFNLFGSSTTTVTQAVATWREGFWT